MLLDKSEVFGKIKSLVEKRDQLLEERPDLKLLQKKFDNTMKKAGKNKSNRCIMAQELMLEYSKKLTEALADLKLDLEELTVRCVSEKNRIVLCKNGSSKRHPGKDRV